VNVSQIIINPDRRNEFAKEDRNMVEQIKTKEDVFAEIDKHNVRFIRLWFTDIW
jgi:hypothetical protein